MHVDEVKRYYEQNTRRFLTFGQGGVEGAIHRAVWGKGVKHRREAFHFVHELILREAKAFSSPLKVLDLGCGVGACLLYLSERLPIEGLGITLSPLQVTLARERLASHPVAASIKFLEGNFERLPPIDMVDVATAIESFVHSTDPNTFMTEVAKVLRPGGKLIVCDDFLSDKVDVNGATEQALLEDFMTGWHVGTLETVNSVNKIAQHHGLKLISNSDLSPHLEFGRLRDRALAVFNRFGKWTGTKDKYFQAMLGGNALQRCLRSRLIEYRFLVWTAGERPQVDVS